MTRARRLATWNLLGGARTDGTVDPAALARSVRALAPDVLALQEVDRAQERSGGVDLARVAAEAMGATHWRFAPALLGDPCGAYRSADQGGEGAVDQGPAYGVALLSRMPVRDWAVLPLAPARWGRMPVRDPVTRRVRLTRDEPRVVLAGRLDGGAGEVTVAVTHLSFVPPTATAQLRLVRRWLGGLPGPRFLLGDLNLPGPWCASVLGWHRLSGHRSYPVHRPRLALDHVLADTPHRVESAGAVALEVSDHRAVTVTLR